MARVPKAGKGPSGLGPKRDVKGPTKPPELGAPVVACVGYDVCVGWAVTGC